VGGSFFTRKGEDALASGDVGLANAVNASFWLGTIPTYARVANSVTTTTTRKPESIFGRDEPAFAGTRTRFTTTSCSTLHPGRRASGLMFRRAAASALPGPRGKEVAYQPCPSCLAHQDQTR